MSRNGLLRGMLLRLRPTDGSVNYIEQKAPAGLATNVGVTWFGTLPGSGTQTMTIDSTGQISYTTPGGGGSVTSVALSAPSIFSVGGSPVTTNGTLALTFASQAANLVLASPDGATGVPTMRSLVAADIPSLTAAKISNFDTQVRASRLDQMTTPTAAVAMGSQKITGLGDPTNLQDAVTKAYVDNVAAGIDPKPSVRVRSNANISISAPGTTIDGVTMGTSDRAMLDGQTAGLEKGIYIWNGAAVPMTRAADMDAATEFPGAYFFVEEGSFAGTGWVCTNNRSMVLGTTPITFTQFNGGSAYTAGNGLTLTGNDFNVVGTANRISVAADSIDISSAYVGQSTITTLGTITTGVWNGTSIALANGGTGATSAAAARTNLGVEGTFRATFTSTTGTNSVTVAANVVTVPHGLGQKVQSVEICDPSGERIHADRVTYNSSNQLTLDFSVITIGAGTYELLVG